MYEFKMPVYMPACLTYASVMESPGTYKFQMPTNVLVTHMMMSPTMTPSMLLDTLMMRAVTRIHPNAFALWRMRMHHLVPSALIHIHTLHLGIGTWLRTS